MPDEGCSVLFNEDQEDDKVARLQRAAALLELLAEDVNRRAQQDTESAQRLMRAAKDIRKSVEDAR